MIIIHDINCKELSHKKRVSTALAATKAAKAFYLPNDHQELLVFSFLDWSSDFADCATNL